MARRREAAVRSTLGAPKWRLVWNAVEENVLLAAIGGSAGLLLASAGLDLFSRYGPIDLPRMAKIHLNLGVFVFSVILTLGASVLFGLLPALQSDQPSAQLDLTTSGRR